MKAIPILSFIFLVGFIALVKYKQNEEFEHPSPSNLHIIVKVDSTWWKK